MYLFVNRAANNIALERERCEHVNQGKTSGQVRDSYLSVTLCDPTGLAYKLRDPFLDDSTFRRWQHPRLTQNISLRSAIYRPPRLFPTQRDVFLHFQDAFEQAFSPPPSRRTSRIIPTQNPVTEVSAEPTLAPTEPTTVLSESTSEGEVAEDSWKQEYEEQVKAWRVQSAEAREKAEKIRDEWEIKRAAEREEAAKRKAAGQPVPEPEVIPGPLASMTSSAVLVHHEKEEEKSEKERDAEVSEPQKRVCRFL